MEVFAERGYHAAAISHIAERAGTAKSVIYDHFASKAQLQITLLERETAEMLRVVAGALQEAPAEPGARLRLGVEAFLDFVENHPFAWRIIFRDPPSDPQVATAYRRLGREVTNAIGPLIRGSAPASMLDGAGGDQRVDLFARMLKDTLSSVAFWWFEHRDLPRDALVDLVLEFVWLGLERVAAGERAG
jgi:AcrR family transcriptional regulator